MPWLAISQSLNNLLVDENIELSWEALFFCIVSTAINQLQPSVAFLYPLKTSENL